MDYSKLRGRIRETFGSEGAFAVAMGFSRCTVSSRLNDKSEWTDGEMVKACELLGIPIDDIPEYFFCFKS